MKNYGAGTCDVYGKEVEGTALLVGSAKDGDILIKGIKFHVLDRNQVHGAPGRGDSRGARLGTIDESGVAIAVNGQFMFRLVQT